MLYCFLWACVSTVQAHPHNWIQLNSTFVLDDQARLIGIKQRWEFDFYYSMIMHADLLNEFGDELLGLSETATAMIKNLKPYTYFSELKAHDAVVDLGMPEKYQLTTTKVDGQLVLVLDMEFDIDQKIPVEGTRLEWRVFDPTYYIAMNHETERNIEIVGGNATECTKQLKFPEPTDEEIDYAQSLDKTQRDTDGLGQLFAETA
ncbi:hypothetical protein A3760_26260, partial [Oleiphilus sp. HI0122]